MFLGAANLLFAFVKPLVALGLAAKSVLSFYLSFYIPISLDWVSFVMLIYTLNEIAAI